MLSPASLADFQGLKRLFLKVKERTACAAAEQEPDRRCGLQRKNHDVILARWLISGCKGCGSPSRVTTGS